MKNNLIMAFSPWFWKCKTTEQLPECVAWHCLMSVLTLTHPTTATAHSIRGPLGQTGTRHGANAEKKREVETSTTWDSDGDVDMVMLRTHEMRRLTLTQSTHTCCQSLSIINVQRVLCDKWIAWEIAMFDLNGDKRWVVRSFNWLDRSLLE